MSPDEGFWLAIGVSVIIFAILDLILTRLDKAREELRKLKHRHTNELYSA